MKRALRKLLLYSIAVLLCISAFPTAYAAKNTPTPPAATPSPSVDPNKPSEEHIAIYTEVMWYMMHVDMETPESEVFDRFAKEYKMPVDDLKKIINEVMVFAYSEDRDPLAEHEIKYTSGELIEVIDALDGVVVLKFQIQPSYSNSATIKQNYHNAEDFIRKAGGEKYKRISYWAVADMADGSVGKVVSFDISEEVIQKVYNQEIVAYILEPYLENLWILPSLQK